MIDIIIPAYNALETLDDTLYSIAYQSMVDKINVYLVDDASTCNYDKLIHKFEKLMNIKLLRYDKNSGPGYAREYGINHSSGKYIVFIDADDSFYDPFSIENLYNKMEETNADMLVTNFSEETFQGYFIHELNYTWFHGKIYRRSFIENNDIHINSTRKDEDEGFNQLCYIISNNIHYEPIVTYFWRNNRKSTTRHYNEYNQDSMFDYAYNIMYAVKEAFKCKNYDLYKIDSLVYKALVYVYFLYLEYPNDFKFDKFNDSLIYLKDIYKKTSLKEEDKSLMYKGQFDACANQVMMKKIINPSILFDDFLELIGKE